MAFDLLAALCVPMACALGYALGRRRGLRLAAARTPSAPGRNGPLLDAAHEMRTPLSGVIGAVDLLLETGLSPEQGTYARAIRSSATSMLRLVDETLASVRLNGAEPIVAETIDIAALVEDVSELLAPRAQAKGLDFAALVAEGAPDEIVGDAGRIRQILLNLAGNAIKFTERGGVGLRVESAETGLAFRLFDTGPGFEPGQADRLFRAFERAPEASAAGSGLGLAISRRLAETMGGTLTGHAEPGVGATFTLTLPCWGAAIGGADGALASRRVAVVSDSAFSGPWLVEWLGARGAAARLVDPAALRDDPAAALATFRPEIVIVDKRADEAADLAALARGCGAGQVLLMLSPAERKALASLAEDGFDGYLVKPLRSSSLLSLLGARDAPGEAAAPTSAASFPSTGGLKVLVAEDDPVSALIALAHLTRLGHASVHVADGASAVSAFEAEAFDVVLVDMRMPRLDGRAAAGRMRGGQAAAARPPALIVALTAEGADAAVDDPRASGLDHVLSKPLDARALEALLASRLATLRIA